MTFEPIPFSKYSGSGNDFVCIDNRDGHLDWLLDDTATLGRFARAVCRRGHGVGADGVIFSNTPEIPEFSDIGARFIEADGNECDLCGNGTGCFTHFVIDAGFVPDREIKILTPAGVIRAQNLEDLYVRVCIPSPERRCTDLEITADGRTFLCDFAMVGVPHAVTYVDDIDAIDVARWGYALRHHDGFGVPNVNVNFVQVLGQNQIAVRTFGAGVEAETLACGTGSSASAIMTAIRHGWDGELCHGKKPVHVRSRSGEMLRVYFCICHETGLIHDVCLETVVRLVLRGQMHPDFIAEAIDGVV